LVSERVDPALVSVWSCPPTLSPCAVVCRHPPLFVTVCSCPLPLNTIQSYQLSLFTKSSLSATVLSLSATILRRPPSPATVSGHLSFHRRSLDLEHLSERQPPPPVPEPAPRPCAATRRVFSATNRHVQSTRHLLLLGTSQRHLRSSRRSLLLLFWPLKLCFGEVQTSPLWKSPRAFKNLHYFFVFAICFCSLDQKWPLEVLFHYLEVLSLLPRS